MLYNALITVFQSCEQVNTHFLGLFLFRIWIKVGNSFKLEIYALFVGVRQTKLCLKTILYLAVIHHQARGEAGPLRAMGRWGAAPSCFIATLEVTNLFATFLNFPNT